VSGDPTLERFVRSAAIMAEQAERTAPGLTDRLATFCELTGDERALDAGTGPGTYALALAPSVRQVVGLDPVPELLSVARRLAEAAGASNVTFVEGDAASLPFEAASVDFAVCARTLHHVRRPELVVAELARVVRSEGKILLVDQLASPDPLEAMARDRLERLRDPSHRRTLSDQDVRGLLEANWLVLRRSQVDREELDVEAFLDWAACEGEGRRAFLDEAARLVERGERAGIALRRSGGGYAMTFEVGWYLAVKPARTAT
jgi:SAM-dependent methyltransferase